jgi:hypothetical protein
MCDPPFELSPPSSACAAIHWPHAGSTCHGVRRRTNVSATVGLMSLAWVQYSRARACSGGGSTAGTGLRSDWEIDDGGEISYRPDD